MALTKKKNANGWYYEGDASDFNLNKGITTGLDSSATVKPQPSGTMTAGNNKINGANPSSPSTNNATRREQYATETQGSTVPESTKIGAYNTVSPVISADRGTTSDSDTRNQYTGYIKKIKGNSFITPEYERLQQEIERSLKESGIDTTKEIYGAQITEAVNNALQAEISEGAYQSQLNQISNKQAYNIQLVNTLTRETRAAISQGKSIQEIADALGQDPRVIQKIANNEQAELIQLSQEYEDEQMRSYLRNKEDMDIQIARNITQYKNLQTNLDYQFDSAMTTLRRNLFDSEWTARGTAAGLGMTGTKYLLDRIQTQYDQQKADLQNTYDYQSANAQIAINNALEDYTLNINRWMEDYASAIKELQGYVWTEFQKASNNLALSADQKLQILSGIKANVEEMKANAMIQYASALESGNTALQNAIANAYGLSGLEISSMGGYYPGTGAAGDLRGQIGVGIADKTNNVGSIKVSATSEALKKLWDEAGIKYTNEGVSNQEGAFWTFETVQDGINALAIALKGRNGSATPRSLKSKGARAIADLPSNLWDKKISDMTDEEFNSLLRAIIKGENVSAYNLLKSGAGLGTGTTTEGGEQVAANYDKNYEKDYTTYLTKGTDGFKKSSQDALIKKFGSWDNFVANANAYKAVVDKQVTDVADVMLRDMIEIRDWLDKDGSMSGLRVPIPGTDSWKYKNMFNQVIKGEALQNLINLKSNGATFGALSNQELGFITDAANWFSIWDSEENFKTELNRKINKILNQYGLTESDFLSSERGTEIPSTQINNSPVNPTSQSVFNTPGYIYAGANYTGAQQSGTVNTGAAPVWQK